jgi:predicted dinucleotide-binding enzyme
MLSNTIFADMMTRPASPTDAPTAFFAGNDQRSRQTAQELAASCGFLAVDCGDLRAARYLEAMAHLNIRIALAGGGTRAVLAYRRHG